MVVSGADIISVLNGFVITSSSGSTSTALTTWDITFHLRGVRPEYRKLHADQVRPVLLDLVQSGQVIRSADTWLHTGWKLARGS